MTDDSLLERLAAELALPDFDLMIVGDGSGTLANTPCGWFCTLYERAKGQAGVSTHFGGTSGGTNNYAELAPYCHALWAYHTLTYGKSPTGPAKPVRVVIVSDSEVTVRCGSGMYARRANGALWAQIAWFEANRYVLEWRHIPRNSNPISAKADGVARKAREAMEELSASPH